MKSRNNFLLLLLILNCSLCIEVNAQNQIKIFELPELPILSNIKLSDLDFKDISYIPLETNVQCMISGFNVVFFNDYSINKIVSGDGYFLIKNGKRLLQFRDDGAYISSVGKIGRGPEEFTNIEDFDINRDNQKTYVLSGWQKKIFLYAQNGEFIKTFNIPGYAREFRLVQDGILCYCGNNSGTNENSFILTDSLGRILKGFPNKCQFRQKSGFGFTHEILFYGSNNKVFKKELYSDTIYVFDNMNFKPHMIIEAGKRLVTPGVRSEADMFKIGANYIQPLNLMEFGDYVYYAFIYKVVSGKSLIYGFIGSEKNNYQAVFNLEDGLINDLDGGPSIIPITTKDDNTIITLIDAITLKKHIASPHFKDSTPKYPEKKKELEKLAASLKETDNPILVLVRLK